MKNCKRRTIFSWIFAFVLLIPMFSIAVRCLYVVINKNAYQSYSYTQSTQYELVDNQTNLVVDKNYQFYTNSELLLNSNNDFIRYSTISTIGGFNANEIKQVGSCSGFQFYSTVNGRFLHFTDFNTLHYYLTFADTSNTLTRNLVFAFTPINTQDNYYLNNVSLIQFGTQSYLDNVFEYSISQFVDKHGNGLINFFGLLEQYFMQSNTANALYFTFANWCLNYVLLVSCVWLLFSVLMWFINYCNYMLNTSFRKGHGD